jgi:hypothetical protein
MGRYGIKRTALYNRLKSLGIEPIKDGVLAYVSGEDLTRLDRLDAEVKTSRQLPQSAIQRTGLFSEQVAIEHSPDVGILSTLSTEQFLELAQAIALALRPSDPFSHYEQLERFAKHGWLIQSRELRELIGRQSIPESWGGFRLEWVTGRWWKVVKDE